MADELKDILSDSNKDIGQDKLLAYLGRTMSAEEQHEFEKQMNDDTFMSDAVEGLQSVDKQHDIEALVQQMNAGLKKQIDKKKKRKEKRKLAAQPWVYYTIVLLLFLAIIGYVVIKKMIAH